MLWRLVAVCAFVWMGLVAGRAPADDRAPSSPLVSDRHHWRKHYTIIKPVVADGVGDRPAAPGAGTPPLTDSIYSLFAAAPPADWTLPEFDDSAWLVRPGCEFRTATGSNQPADRSADVYLRASDPFFTPVGRICQRSTFCVKDRRQVGPLTLSLTYRGGFAAYLNGVEIARANLPPGPLQPDTPAAVYPLEAFFYRSSLKQPRPRLLDPADTRNDQWALRERFTGPITIPADAVREGLNVLALDLRRSVFPAACEKTGLGFAPVGLSTLELRSSGQTVTFELTHRDPAVWTADLTRTEFDLTWSAPNERRVPVRISAARNGFFSGQLAAGTRDGTPLRGLNVEVAPLKHVNDNAAIPAAAVRVRFGQPNPFWPTAFAQLGMNYLQRPWASVMEADRPGARFDVLLDALPPSATCTAVWLTVKTPKDVPAGTYVGAVTVALAGGSPPITVPLHLDLADWTLPDVKDYVGLVNIYQSPETLAEFYKVKPWSEEHWKLIDRSMQLLGEIGNIGLFMPLLAESQMGNPESMVVWIRQPDGTYRYDFSVFDRYLDAALTYHDRLRFIALNVWGYEARLRSWQGPIDYATAYGARVTVLDPATGARTNMKLPEYGTPACEALWRPLLLALRDRLKARGLEGKLLLGLPADAGPDQATAAMFQRILPGAAWAAESHNLIPGYAYDPAAKAMIPVRYNSIVYGGDIPDPRVRRLYGWQHRSDGTLVMNFNRSGSNLLLMGYPPPWAFRLWMEATLACGRNGNGRVGGDYWHMGMPILGQGQRGWGVAGGSGGTMYGRYMHSHSDEAGLGRNCTDLFGPGPDGAVSTVRLENAREGNQEAEARIFIERALRNKARPLPPDLARRCQELLDERTNTCRLAKFNVLFLGAQGWQERSARLYAAAAAVAKKG
jgi:hypothetical protein